jgi:hypothetical protein
MPIALQGALIGLAVAVFLVVTEYLFVKRGAEERAKRQHVAIQLDPIERNRIRQIASFSVLLPPVFAFFFWLLWG